MKDNNDLISLNCPNCQAPLSCNSTEMTITCKHCGTSILIKDFITGSRINSKDQLQSYKTLAENALQISDWKNAYKYYETICKITKLDEDIAIFNALGYICGKLQFCDKLAIDCRKLELNMRILLLNEMKNYTESLKKRDMAIATQAKKNSNTQKSDSTVDIYLRYNPILQTLNTEIQDTKPIKCMCGNILLRTDEECSKCGKSRQEVLEEIKNKRIWVNSFIFMLFSVIFGALAVSGKLSIFNFIVAAILLIMAVSGLNKTTKSEALKNKLNHFFLPIMIVVPVTLMVLLGLCFKPNKPNPEVNTLNSAIIETTEWTTNKNTKIFTEATIEPSTEVQTEIPTEQDTKESTELPKEPTEESTEPLTTEATETEEETELEIITHEYVINYNTGKFHMPSCYTIRDSNNIGTYTGTKEELIEQGYEACKKCKPW